MTETYKALEVDASTGETIERDMTPEEISNANAIKNELETINPEQQAKAEARESALTKLAALGLTQEEIEAL
jgi:cytolysin (calcineurin-like family phosphatase)